MRRVVVALALLAACDRGALTGPEDAAAPLGDDGGAMDGGTCGNGCGDGCPPDRVCLMDGTFARLVPTCARLCQTDLDCAPNETCLLEGLGGLGGTRLCVSATAPAACEPIPPGAHCDFPPSSRCDDATTLSKPVSALGAFCGRAFVHCPNGCLEEPSELGPFPTARCQ